MFTENGLYRGSQLRRWHDYSFLFKSINLTSLEYPDSLFCAQTLAVKLTIGFVCWKIKLKVNRQYNSRKKDIGAAGDIYTLICICFS